VKLILKIPQIEVIPVVNATSITTLTAQREPIPLEIPHNEKPFQYFNRRQSLQIGTNTTSTTSTNVCSKWNVVTTVATRADFKIYIWYNNSYHYVVQLHQ